MTTPSLPPSESTATTTNNNERPRDFDCCLLCYDPFVVVDDIDHHDDSHQNNDYQDNDDHDSGTKVADDNDNGNDDLPPLPPPAEVVQWVGPLDQCHHAVCETCLIQYLRHARAVGRGGRGPGGLHRHHESNLIRCPSIGHPTDDCGTYLSSAVLERYAPSSWHVPGANHGDGDQPPEDGVSPRSANGDETTITRQSNSDDLRQLQASEQAIRQVTKPCSHCGIALWKYGGCDHVACPACGNDMCYQCGTHLYLTGHVVRTCAKCRQGFVDHRHDRLYRRRLLMGLPLLLPGWIVYSLATGCLAIVTGCFCGCFLCGWEEEELEEELEGDANRETQTPHDIRKAQDPPSTTDEEGTGVDFSSVAAGSVPQTPSSSGAVAQETVATSPSANSWDSTTTAASPRSSSPTTTPSSSKSGSFAPWTRGIRRTAVYIGLPFVTYLRDMGWDRAGLWLDDAMALGGGGATAAAAAPGGAGAAIVDIPIHPGVVRGETGQLMSQPEEELRECGPGGRPVAMDSPY